MLVLLVVYFEVSIPVEKDKLASLWAFYLYTSHCFDLDCWCFDVHDHYDQTLTLFAIFSSMFDLPGIDQHRPPPTTWEEAADAQNPERRCLRRRPPLQPPRPPRERVVCWPKWNRWVVWKKARLEQGVGLLDRPPGQHAPAAAVASVPVLRARVVVGGIEGSAVWWLKVVVIVLY